MTDDGHDKRTGRNLAPETLAAQAMGRIDEVTRALVPSVHPSTTYERDADGGYRSGRGYTRPHNPTYDEPEELLATLEGGSDCLLFASGMAAATAVFQSFLPGDHVVAPRVMYWALRTWLADFATSWGLEARFGNSWTRLTFTRWAPRCAPARPSLSGSRPRRTRLGRSPTSGLAAERKPEQLVALLNALFSSFDHLTARCGLEKIKTVGDAYRVVAGLPEPRADHAGAAAQLALDMQAEAARISNEPGVPLKLRIGLNSGPVVAGVIGERKFAYDLWGDSVNMAPDRAMRAGIKTVGDAYRVVAGLPEPRADHAGAAAQLAFEGRIQLTEGT